jgi:uncharacterized repeat protein (TIGR03806 family)
MKLERMSFLKTFLLPLLVFPCLLSAQTLQHRYSFASDASDSVGSASGTLIGNASITNGSLVLPGGGDSDNPSGYVQLPNGIVSSDASIAVECWLTDYAGLTWAEVWCFGDSAAGPGQPPNSGTAYISLIPHSGGNDLRGAFNLTGADEIDVLGPAETPLPLNVEEYVVLTYDAPNTLASLYLNGVLIGSANIPTNLAPANYGDTFNNWFGRDEFGGDPMFSGSIDELRVWNGAVSPLYITLSTLAGPNVLLTNLTPQSVNISLANMIGGQSQQTVVSANFLQVSNLVVTGLATNWISSNPNVLAVNGQGMVTAVGGGSATVSATVKGVTGTSAVINVTGAMTVGYWQFNNSTNLGADSSGQSNTLTTATGSPAYSSAGKFGGALYLNGTSTMSNLSGVFPVGVPVNANPYTIAVWEKIDTGCPNNGGFVGWGVTANGEANSFRLNGANSLDDFWFNNDFVVSSLAANPMDGNWHALAVTWDGTNETMYVDSVNVGTRTPVAPNVRNSGFYVGRTTSDEIFKGWLDDLLIANFALTPEEIAIYQTGNWPTSSAAYPSLPSAFPSNTVYAGTTVTLNVSVIGAPPFQYQWQKNGANISWGTAVQLVLTNTAVTDSGSYDVVVANATGTNTSPPLTVTVNALNAGMVTVGYWQFNQANFLGADSSGLGNTLTIATGTPTYSSAGMFGGSLYLDGNSTMTTLSGAFPIDVPTNADPYTIAVWEKVDSGCPNNGGFIGWGDNNTSEANDFRLNGPNSVDDYWYANDFVVNGLAANPMDGNWHALAVTWDGTNQIMYVDAVNVATRTPSIPNVQAAGFVVGKTTADVNFKGWMEDLLIANAALTPADLAAYQAGAWSANLSTYPVLPTASPSNTVFAGTTVTLNVAVAGTPPFQYQWQQNGTNIAWGTGASLILTNATPVDSGSYDVIVGNAFGTNTSPSLVVTVNPPSAPVFTAQPSPAASTNYVGGYVTFTAVVSGTLPIQLQWQHNGINIPNATAAALTLASLQIVEGGTYMLSASNSLGFTKSSPVTLTVLPPPNPGALNVLTYHNDNTRQGANTNEVVLTPANVNVKTFGRLRSYSTDGYIYAQPLYVSGLVIPGQGTRNVIFVATENNSVYAFDADSNSGTNGGLLWQTNLGPSVSSYTGEFGTRYQGTYYGDIVPVVGITGTPVIDLASGTLYLSVHTREVGAATNYYHRIHALNITNGAEQSYSPVIVSNSVPGRGVGSTNGIVSFSAIDQNQRPGLTLAGGMLYVAYGSYADTDPYHGWILGFNATNLAQSSAYAFNTTPNATIADFGVNAGEGALWMGGNGLCADASNNLFFATANGSFSANTNGGDYADSFVKLSTSNGFAVADYFTPWNQASLAANDTDLGSGGTILLPDAAGSAAHPHLMIGAGKEGTLHLVDRDNMGRFNPANDNQIVQEVPGAIAGAWSTPAYFNQQIYYQASGDVMKAFLITNGVIVPTPVSESTTGFSALGGTPFISANGTNNGIAWTIQSDGLDAVLHAYNATNLAQELYNSSQNVARDNPGGSIKMTAPIAVDGKVILGTQYTVSVFGNSLFLDTPLISPGGGAFTNSLLVTLSDTSPNSSIYYTLDGTLPTTNSILYTGPFVLKNSTLVQAIAAEFGAVNSGLASASFVNTAATGNGTGLLGEYWANTSAKAFTNVTFSAAPTLTRTDATINFNWSVTGPSPAVGQTNFTALWQGCVQPEYSETYTFTTIAQQGVQLWVNGQLLISAWTTNAVAQTNSATLSLNAQELYNVELKYFQTTGNAEAQLFWNSPSTPQAIIPQTQLYPFTNPPPSVALIAPANNATYTASASVTVSANAATESNTLNGVSFYLGSTLLGTVRNAPYTLTTTGLGAGTYTLTAVAVDGSGLSATSAPVNITVNPATGLPYGLTNLTSAPAFYNMPTVYTGTLPALLSQTGVFTNTPAMTPVASLIPYAPNVQLFSDNAQKIRYFSVPNTGAPLTPSEQITYAPTNNWSFPAGTVFVKTFELQTNTSDPTSLLRLETRLLVLDTNGAVYGVTYKWRADYSDADLLSSSQTEPVTIQTPNGLYTNLWYYPSPSDCLQCHTAVANYVLGANARQFNRTLTYSNGVTDNELRALNRAGLFNPAIDEATITNIEALSALTNLSASYQQRARSYLDANCAQCHQPGGTGPTFDARYDTPLAQQNIIGVPAIKGNLGYDNVDIVTPDDVWRSSLYDRMNVVNPLIQMPPLARNLIDTNAAEVMAEWINSLPGTPALPPPTLNPTGGTFQGSVSVSLEDASNNAAIYYTLDGSLPTTSSTLYTGPFVITNTVTLNANAWESGYSNSVVGTALFIIQPNAYFTGAAGFSNGMFAMALRGPVGSNYVLEVSTNLQTWSALSTNTATNTSFTLTDPSTPSTTSRFYRVLQQP